MVVNQNLVPIVIEKSGRTERAYDIYSRLLKDRIVFLGGTIDDDTANLIIAQFLFLSNEDTKSDIHFYINSPGGSITAGFALYDTMQFLRCDVATYCVGQAASIFTGEQGPQGAVGPSGGATGEKGDTGADGKQGEQGLRSLAGRDGAAGKDGADGRDGADGKDGNAGKDGLAGQDGADGRDGQDGGDG